MLYSILLVTELLLSIGLIVLILLQHGKGADAGAAFGSGASGTVFGAKGAGNFLSRATGILATLFFINCLGLAFVVSQSSKPAVEQSVVGDSVIETAAEQETVSAPVAGDIPVDSATGTKGAVTPSDVPNQ